MQKGTECSRPVYICQMHQHQQNKDLLWDKRTMRHKCAAKPDTAARAVKTSPTGHRNTVIHLGGVGLPHVSIMIVRIEGSRQCAAIACKRATNCSERAQTQSFFSRRHQTQQAPTTQFQLTMVLAGPTMALLLCTVGRGCHRQGVHAVHVRTPALSIRQ